MKRFRLVKTWWFRMAAFVFMVALSYFGWTMQHALEAKPAELVKLYKLAKERRFDELESNRRYEGRTLFRALDEEKGPVESFRVTGIYLWLPMWGEIYGTAYRRGVRYRVVGALEYGEVNYFSEYEDNERE